ncbi:MAG: 5-formyltetrahydrofolate cyclo-ligase [Betaproteobacteria bacterium]
MTLPDDIRRWRKLQRAKLLARRVAVGDVEYRQWNATITHLLLKGFPLLHRMTVAIYWPFRGEFDPRFAMRIQRAHGAMAALPVVVQKGSPLQFRQWWPGAPMTRGVFDLPVPDGTTVVVPQALLIPPVGFDTQGYRLGYGGGYFDRTLALMTPQPLKIGVAFELSRIATIHPQPHDVAMDFIVTEGGIHRATRNGDQGIDDPLEVAELSQRLVRERARSASHRAKAFIANYDDDDTQADARRYASSPFHACKADPAGNDA